MSRNHNIMNLDTILPGNIMNLGTKTVSIRGEFATWKTPNLNTIRKLRLNV